VPALPVVFTRRAARQVESADAWWSANRPAAPNALRDDLRGVVALIGEQPLCGTPTPNRRHAGLRRIHLPRVDYHLYYRMAPRMRRIQVVAFWHAKRGMPPPI
jgi:plasmid stabilization system protein ParE